ncbi:hypothetical protein BDN72DRAFT_198888 [Pluteus cervinus]|uniref:Uncharacterized protein n=1 Tax=Pluteus cervinus TaxID=181527 RepID=A0ACD3B6Q2_9AGAR|nr:hypothetical protein BDN72DRAFT_198888 [Pluteus cervinus]
MPHIWITQAPGASCNFSLISNIVEKSLYDAAHSKTDTACKWLPMLAPRNSPVPHLVGTKMTPSMPPSSFYLTKYHHRSTLWMDILLHFSNSADTPNLFWTPIVQSFSATRCLPAELWLHIFSLSLQNSPSPLYGYIAGCQFRSPESSCF